VTGLDLVELQLRIADGEPLPITQDDVRVDGHAIEVRVVAEDPAAGWLPSTGTLERFEIGEGVRVDTGARTGTEVTTDYDSLLAKVIVHAPTRGDAARRLARALRSAWIAGVATDVPALVAILTERDYLAAETPTSYLDEHPDVATSTGPVGDDRVALLLGAVFANEYRSRTTDRTTGFAPSGWRNLRTIGQRQTWTDGETAEHVEYAMHGRDAAEVRIGPWPAPTDDGSLSPEERRVVEVRLFERSGSTQIIEVDGVRHRIDVLSSGDTVHVRSAAGSATWTLEPRFVDHDLVDAGGGPTSPLPGTVLSVHVAAGDHVEDGGVLVIVEAMKMEHKICAVGDVTVAEVLFGEGDRVDAGDLLVRLETPDE
ncbi:MAG: acetyl-CoA carboxylase biotin carboxylase subunit, partial [Acidimicrobiales bacterium]|nr:acetyl-CoA carboxylase biotin carboxylase subunit [Acidimicrobiales bacterium]